MWQIIDPPPRKCPRHEKENVCERGYMIEIRPLPLLIKAEIRNDGIFTLTNSLGLVVIMHVG